MESEPGLDAGLFVGGNDEFIGAQRLSLPTALVEVEHLEGFSLEVRVARENPTAVLPGTDRVLVEPTPDGSATDLGDDAALGDFTDQILSAESGQRQSCRGWQFTGQCLDLHDDFWGEKQAGARFVVRRPNLRGVPRRSVCATC